MSVSIPAMLTVARLDTGEIVWRRSLRLVASESDAFSGSLVSDQPIPDAKFEKVNWPMGASIVIEVAFPEPIGPKLLSLGGVSVPPMEPHQKCTIHWPAVMVSHGMVQQD